MRNKIIVVVSLLATFLKPIGHAFGEEDISSLIRKKLQGQAKVAGENLHAKTTVKSFYEEKKFVQVWTDGTQLTPQAKDLLKEIDASKDEGLEPSFYHKSAIETILHDGQSLDSASDDTAKLEILLTDAFFTLASNYRSGVVNPFNFRVRWFDPLRRSFSEASRLTANELCRGWPPCPPSAMDDHGSPLLSHPSMSKYLAMKKELAKYRKLKDVSWPVIPKGDKLKLGDTDPRIGPAKQRLALTGELKSGKDASPGLFDEKLEAALKEFQKNHGLFVDGVLGDKTVIELNKDAHFRECQLIVNMDRVRGLSKIFSSEKYIQVNVPNFEVDVVENGKSVLNAKAIVGKKTRETPLMSDKVRFIVFSPKWRVPKKIAVEDKLPEIQKDPDFFIKHQMAVFKKMDDGLEEVDTSAIDWSQTTAENFDYVIVQDSGDQNALGHIKFMFPNKNDVYMHDTPSKKLFESTTRNFSSGCVRINKPVEMAEYLLRDKPEWTKEKIEKEMHRPKELFVNLTEPVPVHLIYLTAWADSDGVVQFRRDIYGYDSKARKVLCDVVPTGRKGIFNSPDLKVGTTK